MTTHLQSKPRRMAWLRDWLSRWSAVLLLAVVVPPLAIGAFSIGVMWLLMHEDQAPVLRETPAGRVLRVELHGGFFNRALVETDRGYYALADAVSLPRGESMTEQARAGGRRFLCDSQHRCIRLLRPWP